MSFIVELHGPLFNGEAERAAEEAAREIEKRTATTGVLMLRAFMNTVFRKQTPRYRLLQEAVPTYPGWKIWDQQKVVYGWWLEGISRRNKTTRFKGYRSYRITTQRLRPVAREIGKRVVQQYLPRMGGK